MNNGEILAQAVVKALGNGWKHIGLQVATENGSPLKYNHNDWNKLVSDPSKYYHIIFSHDFAQAYWGTEIIQTDLITEVITLKLSGEVDGVQYQKLPAWQWHLQQLVLYENPLDYIAKFI